MKTFLFGIDGASPDLVNKWIRQGHLPNLEEIKEGGISGKLESTFPPLTGPAWSSFQTGVNPGKHGVFNWLDLSDSYKGRVVNSKSIKTKTVWNLINRGGGKVGIVSLPVTYPAEKLDGFLVPGFLTPSNDKEFGYPKEVAKTLLEETPNFQHHPPFFTPNLDPRKWVNKLNRTIQTKGKAARLLYKKYLNEDDASVFMVHFFSTDHVQHKLWNYREGNWDPRLEVFKEADRQIGKLMELAPAETTFMVISDHGFGPVERIFNVNNWLYKKELLKFQGNFISFLKRKLSDVGLTQEQLKPVGDRLYPLVRKLKFIDNSTTGVLTNNKLHSIFLSYKDVNWKKTSAYSRSDIGHVRLNLKGREERGTVSNENYNKIRGRIIEELSQVDLPENKRKLADWVRPKEETYFGPFLKDAPDVLFNPLPNATVGYGAVMFVSSQIFDINPNFDPGHHRRNGILMASGPTVQPGKRDADIIDIAPTLLNLFNYPVPEQMDGEVIREIAPDEPTYHRPVDFYRSRKVDIEFEDSRKKLENLGYL